MKTNKTLKIVVILLILIQLISLPVVVKAMVYEGNVVFEGVGNGSDTNCDGPFTGYARSIRALCSLWICVLLAMYLILIIYSAIYYVKKLKKNNVKFTNKFLIELLKICICYLLSYIINNIIKEIILETLNSDFLLVDIAVMFILFVLGIIKYIIVVFKSNDNLKKLIDNQKSEEKEEMKNV